MPYNISFSRLAAAVCLLLVAMLSLGSGAQAQVVISQVYGGGGNSGATWKNDFIELLNTGSAAVRINGWSVQYASSSGSSWSVTPIAAGSSDVFLQPGQYYLVQEAPGAGGTKSLTAPDAMGTIAMSATAAKVALAGSTSALSGACPSGGTVKDLVGYGTANCPTAANGGTAPLLTNTTAAVRVASGCSLTGKNSADFVAGDPTPRNSSSPLTLCSSGTASSPTLALNASTSITVSPAAGQTATSMKVDLTAIGGAGSVSLSPNADGTFSGVIEVGKCSLWGLRSIPIAITYVGGNSGGAYVPVTVVAPAVQALSIHEIQGPGSRSSYECLPVSFSGVVTYTRSNSFFMQEPGSGGGDSATDSNTASFGILVFVRPTTSVAIGNIVTVTGLVQEYVPSGDPNSAPETEIASNSNYSATISTPTSTGNPLPAAVNISSLDPNGGGEQLERYEGMRVHVDSLSVTGATLGTVNEPAATSTSNGLFFGVLPNAARPFREAGIEWPDPIPNPPCCIPRFDGNPERLRVDTSVIGSLDLTTGATVSNITGPLEYGYRTYSIVAEPGISASGNINATAVPAPDASEFTVANMNLQHFYDTVAGPAADSTLTATALANRISKVALAVRDVMHLPDIIGVEEMENTATLQQLADAINAGNSPSPNYQVYLYDGNDMSGINVGLLVKSWITVNSVTQYGKTDTIPETNSIMNDRPPIVLSASISNQGETMPFYVVVNHLRSLDGVDDPASIARPKRKAQAEYLADLIQNGLGNSVANIVSVGDYNAYEHEAQDGYVDVMGTITGDPTDADHVAEASPVLVDPKLTDLASTLPAEQRYSYIYDGTAQELDHVLVNQNMMASFSRFAIARNNADFPEGALFRNDPTRPERFSDHDMPVAYFKLPTDSHPPVLTVPADMTAEATGPSGATVTFTVSANDSWDGPTPVTCAPASGSMFQLGTTTVQCSSTDAHNNTGTASFNVTVQDTTPPVVSVTGVTNGTTYTLGAVPNANCSTTDLVGVATPATLAITGGTANGVGGFTATCSGARDTSGNAAAAVSVGYNVVYGFSGLVVPTGAGNGANVPVKWQLRDAKGNLITSISSVQALLAGPCGGTTSIAQPLAGTALRFDASAGQFVFNWLTKGLAPGCNTFTVALDDGSSPSVNVQVK